MCEVVWDVETADRVERLLGGPCEGRCPFVPDLAEEEDDALEAG